MPKVYKKGSVEENVLDLAIERTRYIFDSFDNVVVSCSGGKDSTAVLNVALHVAREKGLLPLKVMFNDEEVIYPQVIDYMRRLSREPDIDLAWFCLPLKYRCASTYKQSFWYPWAKEAEHLWVRELPEEGIVSVPGYDNPPPEDRIYSTEMLGLLLGRMPGTTVNIAGLRAEESLNRYRTVANHKIDNYISKHSSTWGGGTSPNALFKAYPIYDWTVWDVWKLVGDWELDYCAAYDLMLQDGIPIQQQRIATPFAPESMADLNTYQKYCPELWNKAVHRVEGANTQSRYAHSALYGQTFNDIWKPDNQTWREFIEGILNGYDADTRALLAKAIRSLIRGHYRRTKDPILGYTPHYQSAVSWKRLAQVAYAGDVKARKAQGWFVLKKDMLRAKKNYMKALKTEERQ